MPQVHGFVVIASEPDLVGDEGGSGSHMLIVDAAAKIAAAPSPAAGFDITQLLQFGVLGLVLLCVLLRKWLVPEWSLKQAEDGAAKREAELTQRVNEMRDQLERMQSVFQDRMIPTLTQATEINVRYTEELQKARYARDREKNHNPETD